MRMLGSCSKTFASAIRIFQPPLNAPTCLEASSLENPIVAMTRSTFAFVEFPFCSGSHATR